MSKITSGNVLCVGRSSSVMFWVESAHFFPVYRGRAALSISSVGFEPFVQVELPATVHLCDTQKRPASFFLIQKTEP